MDDPTSWRWIWLTAAALFGAAEMLAPGSFFLAPFAVGALAATVLSFLGVATGVTFVVFLAASLAAFFALRPLARRLDETETASGVGASRLIGRVGTVLNTIPPGSDSLGQVRVDREVWGASGLDSAGIPEGTAVEIIEVRGTRLMVWPASLPRPTPETT